MSLKNLVFVSLAGILWCCALGLQRPPPRYSQQFMPETSFTCRNKIVGSYYADPEADCQLFHVCVSVAGLIQDYKFLCPNDTAFDQESQTCANWYDVDCEAATLYYASDNFDLYRIGSGLESLHYDTYRSDAEPQDHLQRSETNDPVRSAANNYNRVAQNNYNNQNNNNNNNKNNNYNSDNYNNQKGDILRGSSSSNFYNSRNNGKEEDYDNEKNYEPIVEAKKKPGVRKVARKQQFYNNNNNNNENNYVSSTTAAPVSSTTQHNNNNNYYNSYNSRRNNNHYEATSSSSSTTVRPIDDYSKQFNVKHNIQTSTHRPSSTAQQTFSTYQVSSTTVKAPVFNNNNNNNNNNNVYGNQKSNTLGLNTPTTAKSVTYNQNFNQYSPSTPRSTSYSQNYQDKYNNQDTQFNQNSRTPSTTVAPSTNYQQTDYTHFQQRNYNNIQRSTSTTIFPSTTAAPSYVDNNSNKFNSKSDGITSSRISTSQTTKFYPNYSANNFAPTTYSPITTKKNNDNNGQYRDSNIQSSKSTQYFDSTKPPKKNNQYNNYDSSNNSGKYYETSTANYDFVRSQGIGFSPSSINLLAETPKTTTLAPRRTAAPTTYNPNNFNYRGSQQYTTTPRGSTYNSGSTRPFSSTPTFTDDTTSKPKSTKKNDYDYAYYDNAGALEYDGLDLENVARNKESSKIARN